MAAVEYEMCDDCVGDCLTAEADRLQETGLAAFLSPGQSEDKPPAGHPPYRDRANELIAEAWLLEGFPEVPAKSKEPL